MRDKIINTQGINELKHELLWTLESIKKKKNRGKRVQTVGCVNHTSY